MSTSVGSIRKVVIDGVSYDVMGDANLNFKRSKYEKEGIATSGNPLIKMTKRVENVESVDLAVSVPEMEVLSGKANSIVDSTLSFEFADGSVYRGTGHIHFDGYESETGKSTLTMIPVGDWTPFSA